MLTNYSNVTDKINDEVSVLLKSEKIQDLILDSLKNSSFQNKIKLSNEAPKINFKNSNNSEIISEKLKNFIENNQNYLQNNVQQSQFPMYKNPFQQNYNNSMQLKINNPPYMSPNNIFNQSSSKFPMNNKNKNFERDYNFLNLDPNITMHMNQYQKDAYINNLKYVHQPNPQYMTPYGNYLID